MLVQQIFTLCEAPVRLLLCFINPIMEFSKDTELKF